MYSASSSRIVSRPSRSLIPPAILPPPPPLLPGPRGLTTGGKASSALSDVPMSVNTSMRTSVFFEGSTEAEPEPARLSLSLPFPADDRPGLSLSLSFLSGTERRGARRAEQSGAMARRRARRTRSRRWSRTLSTYACASAEARVVVCRRWR